MKQRSRLPDKRYSKAHDAYLAADAADIPQPDKTRFTRDGHSAPVTSSRAEQSQSKPDCTSTATKPKGNPMATYNEMFPKRFFNCENTPPGGITLTVKAVYEGVVNKQTEEEGWIMSFHESEMEYPLKPEATGILFNELDAYDNQEFVGKRVTLKVERLKGTGPMSKGVRARRARDNGVQPAASAYTDDTDNERPSA
jgi:hypothetical protein